jgi:hypothetical protein
VAEVGGFAEWLLNVDIAYRWGRGLGGRWRISASSPSVALEPPAFRAYADHHGDSEYADTRAEVLVDTQKRCTVIMRSETLWLRRHRRLNADSVVLLDHVQVEHVFRDGQLVSNAPMPEARIDDSHLAMTSRPLYRPRRRLARTERVP